MPGEFFQMIVYLMLYCHNEFFLIPSSSYLELLANALDRENWSLVQFMSSSYSGYDTSSLQQVKKFTNLPETIMYDLREGSLRGLEEGGTTKEIEFKLYCFCIFFQFLVLEFKLEIYFVFEY
ncbi:uncharacterized protein DS421_20g678370 [Arachis hypogaea]|nr:uncharacterized protein DS421_20g678370 [Arachis hypogaea]